MQPSDHLERNPFPEFHIPPEELDESEDDLADPSDRPPVQHAINSGEKAVMEKSPIGDVPTGQEDFMSNEERAKEEVQKGEAEQMPPGTESSSEKQSGSGKVYCVCPSPSTCVHTDQRDRCLGHSSSCYAARASGHLR